MNPKKSPGKKVKDEVNKTHIVDSDRTKRAETNEINASNQTEGISEKQEMKDQPLLRTCKECGSSEFEYDEYWKEYTCEVYFNRFTMIKT